MLQTCIYLATLGKQGLKEVARQSYDKAHYAAELIGRAEGYRVRNSQFFANSLSKRQSPPPRSSKR